jgi:hypothetical protein
MHAILVDWLLEISEDYGLGSTTFCLSVHLLDQYLARGPPVPKLRFQLLGCSCLLIAAKMEEMSIPSVEDFLRTADYCFSARDLFLMEIDVLKCLDYNVASFPTRRYFLLRYLRAAGLQAGACCRECSFASMLVDLSMQVHVTHIFIHK